MIAKISELAAELLITAWYAEDTPYQEAQESGLLRLRRVRNSSGLYLAQDAWLAEYTKTLA